MTAEIAVANKSAVALAADSKVTIGGGRSTKTYDTVNKVFTLSKVHPVGIMIFGNAEFMNYPWETIIKLYRKARGSIQKDYIKDWSADFVDYLENFGRNADHHRDENIKSIVAAWLFQVEEDARSKCINEGTPIPSEAFDSSLLDALQTHINLLGAEEQWLGKTKTAALFKKHGAAILEAISTVFAIEPDSDLFKAALALSITALVRKVDSPLSSGFVIAGFGEKEYFPTVIEHNTDGFIGDSLKLRIEEPRDISRANKAYIGAFAQKDTAQNFMNGFDPILIERMAGLFSGALEDSCLTILEKYGNRRHNTDIVRSEIRNAAAERVSLIVDDLIQHSQELFSGPVVRMVGLLPKDELAHLAESLVALTSLRRRVSQEIETVGGPVDVALISKGDGFVWIKRKHYFRPELNPQFAQNYLADARKED